jgi:hypothetical protein
MRIILVSFIACLAALAQQESSVVHRSTFKESDTAGWNAFGSGSILVNHGALELSYELGTKNFSAAAWPVSVTLADTHRLRFTVKSDHDTAIAVMLIEKSPGGGHYSTWFWAPANTLQQIELAPSDFSLDIGPNDPVDADGKLDFDQLQSIALIDTALFFGQLADRPNFPVMVSKSTGQHKLVLAGFEIVNGAAGHRQPNEKMIPIDRFDRGFNQWMTLGGMKLKLNPRDNPLGVPGLEVSYEQIEGQLAVLIHRLSNFDLAKAKRVSFDIASDHDTTLVVSLELKKPGGDGPRYTATIYPPANRKVFHVNLALSDFERDQNQSGSAPAKLDPSQLNSIAITDISAATGGDTGPNTIWIGNLEAQIEPRP